MEIDMDVVDVVMESSLGLFIFMEYRLDVELRVLGFSSSINIFFGFSFGFSFGFCFLGFLGFVSGLRRWLDYFKYCFSVEIEVDSCQVGLYENWMLELVLVIGEELLELILLIILLDGFGDKMQLFEEEVLF